MTATTAMPLMPPLAPLSRSRQHRLHRQRLQLIKGAIERVQIAVACDDARSSARIAVLPDQPTRPGLRNAGLCNPVARNPEPVSLQRSNIGNAEDLIDEPFRCVHERHDAESVLESIEKLQNKRHPLLLRDLLPKLWLL